MPFPNLLRSPIDIQGRYQFKQLQQHLTYTAEHSLFYQQQWATAGIHASQLNTLEDVSQFPFTTKEDLQLHNDAFLCVPRRNIVEYVTTSGTMGHPVLIALTEQDLQRLAYNERSSYELAGLTAEDTILLTTTMDRRFMAGLAYWLGARALGAGIVRVGAGALALQWDTIARVQPTVLIGVPSFLLKLIDYAQREGIDLAKTSLKKAICIGEPVRGADFGWTALGQRLAQQWALEWYSTYATTEIATAFTECQAGQGGHANPALAIVEVLDEQDRPVGEGQVGEVVVTPLHVQGMPLVRFRTGDLCAIYRAPCTCGRTSVRLGPVIGRLGQQIKYKGTTLYPPALYNLLYQFEAIKGFVVEVRASAEGTDELRLWLLTEQPHQALEQRIRAQCQGQLRVVPSIQFVDEPTLKALQFPEGSRKPVWFVDQRSH